MNVPTSPKGVLAIIGLLLVLMFAVYTTTVPAFLMGLVATVVIVAIVYYAGYHIDQLLKNGF